MVTPSRERPALRMAHATRGRLIEDLERLVADAGISHAALARAAGVSPSFLARIVAGTTWPSLETWARLGSTLGADLSCRLYPNTGPAIRDRHQGRIVEGLLGVVHRRWQRFGEIAVRRPARGWIDLVLYEPRDALVVATEVESALPRIEQLIRWSTEKAASLPSWERWPGLPEPPEVSRLLVVRRTRTTRDAAACAEQQLRLAYPSHPADALSALCGNARWPGPALIWARIERDAVRFMDGR